MIIPKDNQDWQYVGDNLRYKVLGGQTVWQELMSYAGVNGCASGWADLRSIPDPGISRSEAKLKHHPHRDGW